MNEELVQDSGATPVCPCPTHTPGLQKDPDGCEGKGTLGGHPCLEFPEEKPPESLAASEDSLRMTAPSV
ncbi:GM18954 [Drosophila sechellia]|nr:GM18954 [Drosophila sechellia]